jgi:TPR repeat protein
MGRLPIHRQIFALTSLLLVGIPGLADTAAGVAAFKNKDYRRAYQEWKAAAEAGQAEAEFDLGLLYAQGLGVRRDLSEAMRLYRSAADKGNAEAEFALGRIYLRGWGTPRDEVDAIRWMMMANSVEAAGPPTDWVVLEGYGISRDPGQSVYWYDRAARNGHPEAQYELALLYDSGEGTKRDAEQAARWMSAAAAQGYAPAMMAFGERYATGNGVAQDHQRAYFWLTLAFLHGEKRGEKLRAAEAAKLRPETVAQQERAAQDWRPRSVSAPKR